MTDRRLIEDSLPLAEISEQSAREKYIRKGHFIHEQVQAQEAYWHNLGVFSVPTVVINGSSVLKGAQPVDVYKEVFSGLLKHTA